MHKRLRYMPLGIILTMVMMMINFIRVELFFSRALSHNNEHMGKRYIEVFESKYSEMEWVVTRMQGSHSDSEGVVRLRGLPYGAQKQDIAEFFAGMPLYVSQELFLIILLINIGFSNYFHQM